MKAILKLYSRHLLAPSVADASKLLVLLGKCRTMDRSYDKETFVDTYVSTEEGDRGHNMDAEVQLVRDDQVLMRIPKSRRIGSGAAPS